MVVADGARVPFLLTGEPVLDLEAAVAREAGKAVDIARRKGSDARQRSDDLNEKQTRKQPDRTFDPA